MPRITASILRPEKTEMMNATTSSVSVVIRHQGTETDFAISRSTLPSGPTRQLRGSLLCDLDTLSGVRDDDHASSTSTLPSDFLISATFTSIGSPSRKTLRPRRPTMAVPVSFSSK